MNETPNILGMRICIIVLIVTLTLIGLILAVSATNASAHGNPPGTTCTGYRYGKGGGKTCIRWSYPTTTVTP